MATPEKKWTQITLAPYINIKGKKQNDNLELIGELRSDRVGNAIQAPQTYPPWASLSGPKLKKLAREHGIAGRSKMSRRELVGLIALFYKQELTHDEWVRISGGGWDLLDCGSYMNEERSMIVGNLSNEARLLAERHLTPSFSLVQDAAHLGDLAKQALVKSTHFVVQFGQSSFKFVLLQRAGQLLGPKFQIFLNTDGFLLCRSQSKFALIAPIAV